MPKMTCAASISPYELSLACQIAMPSVTAVLTMYTGRRPYLSANGMKRMHPTANPRLFAANELLRSL